jgi:phosphate-selective porin OprO/OprP
VNKLIRYSALAVFIGTGFSGAALADSASTTGGVKIKSDDGNFEAAISGRIHFDGSLQMPDDGNDALGISKPSNNSGFFFRRVFLTLTGKAYGWDYHVDEDFAGGNTSVSATSKTGTCSDGKGGTVKCVTSVSTSVTGGTAAGFNDVWIGHDVLGNDHIYIGQHKPWRSLDEMASNNNTVFMERNILSANGLYGGRDFTQGVYYKYASHGFWAGASFYTDGKAGSTTGRSFGSNARLAYAPIVQKDMWLHAGLNYSFDNISEGGDGFKALSPTYSTWYGKKSNTSGFALASFTGGTGNNVSGSTGAIELAGDFGPVFFQAEYGVDHQWESQPSASAPGVGLAATIDAFSVTTAWMVTGEVRPYSAGDASYGGIKPNHTYGAFELAARYDHGRNRDLDACAVPAVVTGAATASGSYSCSVSSVTVAGNYYVNPNVRFMLDYQIGIADGGDAGKDIPRAFMARAQFGF